MPNYAELYSLFYHFLCFWVIASIFAVWRAGRGATDKGQEFSLRLSRTVDGIAWKHCLKKPQSIQEYCLSQTVYSLFCEGKSVYESTLIQSNHLI